MEYKPEDLDQCGDDDSPSLKAEIDFLRKALAQVYDLTGVTATEDGWVVDSHDSGNLEAYYAELYAWCIWRQLQNPVVIIPEPPKVSEWQDASGNGHTLSQPDENLQPTLRKRPISEPKASSTGEDGRSQEESADGGKAVMEEAND
jgi:hypothetical protein